jgi:hypothetical protein
LFDQETFVQGNSDIPVPIHFNFIWQSLQLCRECPWIRSG